MDGKFYDQLKADLVFDGGGAKGIAYVGALEALEMHGFTPNSIAGTSGGAIVAALVAVGYKAADIKQFLWELDYTQMTNHRCNADPLNNNDDDCLLLYDGVYRESYIEVWLRAKLLSAPHPAKFFIDLKCNLKIIASDISMGQMIVLPDDIKVYGQIPSYLDIACAVRMSISLPFFFEPVKLQSPFGMSYIIDGTVLSEYPIGIFDRERGHVPRWPTFGFRMIEPGPMINKIYGPVSMFAAVFSAMLALRNQQDLLLADEARTVNILTDGRSSVDFDDFTDSVKNELITSGKIAADQFLSNWDFDAYIQRYRVCHGNINK